MYDRPTFIFIGVLMITAKANSQDVLLPSSVDQWENTDVNLTCTCTCLPTNLDYFKFVRWYQQNTGMSDIVTYRNQTCTSQSPLLFNSSLYSYGCSEEMYSLRIKNISRNNDNDTWACKTGPSFNKSNGVTIRVKVPVRSLEMIPNIDSLSLKENSTLIFNSRTSPCRPEPTFKWYVIARDVENPLLLKTVNTSGADSVMQEFNSSFSLVANRSLNGWRLYSEAFNRIDEKAIRSKEVMLDVLYPPEIPVRILGVKNGSMYNVTLGNNVNLTCSVTGGNPLPQLEWNTGDMGPSIVSNVTVSRAVILLARERNRTELQCRSINPLANYTANVVVNVLYPPDAPELKILNIKNQSVNVPDQIRVTENSTLTLTCTANSNPPPNLFNWSRFTTDNTSTLVIPNIQRAETGPITCHIYNEMVPTVGNPVRGTNVSKIYIDVLYPPEVKIMTNRTLIEGENLSCDCTVKNGNPNITNFHWRNTTDDTVIQTGVLLQIDSISKTATGRYTCVAENVMNSTDGTILRGTGTGQFFLDVQYPAYVSHMMVDSQSENNVTLNENDTVKIVCTVEGNPLPAGGIIMSTPLYDSVERDKELASLRTDRIFETEFVASCYDAGEYTCTSNNTLYTGELQTSTKNVTVYINCAPRMSRIHSVKKEVYTSIHVPVTLTFTAVAYPVPPISGYTWFRQVNDINWTNITRTTSMYNVSTKGLQSSLTVTNVTKSDFGLYNLTITNSIGTFIFNFVLIPTGKPSPPVRYGIIQETITDNSITVWWEPEFAGGAPQHFIISYRMSFEDTWLNISSSGEDIGKSMKSTIGNLKSRTRYGVLIYAENKFGSVRIGSEIVGTTTKTGPPPTVAAIAGGGVAGAVTILFVVGVTVVFYRRRKAKPSRSDNVTKGQMYHNLAYSNPVDVTKDHTYHNLPNSNTDDVTRDHTYHNLPNSNPDDVTKHMYHNLANNEFSISSSTVYQTLQTSPTDIEQQYQQLATATNTEHGSVEKLGHQKVYENLRMAQFNKEQRKGNKV